MTTEGGANAQPTVPVVVGDILHLGEPDYCYGRGPLRLRVTAVFDALRMDDGWWLNVRGVELRADGSDYTDEERYALVRLSALRPTTRPTPTVHLGRPE